MPASVAMETWNSSAGDNHFRALAVAITDHELGPICSTARPAGARVHAARTEKPLRRVELPDGKAAAYRVALSNRVAPSTAIPSMVGIEMRNIASRRVPAIGANHISMSRAFLR